MKYTMYCNQCEQTQDGIACMGKSGVCGKNAVVSELQNLLTEEILNLAKVCREEVYDDGTVDLILHGLAATVSNVNYDEKILLSQIQHIKAEQERINKGSTLAIPKTKGSDSSNGETQAFEHLLLLGLKGMAVYMIRCLELGVRNQEAELFLIQGLQAIGAGYHWADLYPMTVKLGGANLMVLRDLERAHYDSYGEPTPVVVPLLLEPGPFILVAGHNLKTLEQVLKAAEKTQVKVITAGELLCAHGYPRLRTYPCLKGHCGGSWQHQRHDFESVPAPILLTDNCALPGQRSDMDRLYTSGDVQIPGCVHLDKPSDYQILVTEAIRLKGYHKQVRKPSSNDGIMITTGYGRTALIHLLENMWTSYEQGKIRHFIVIGGCDGSGEWRSYYTRLVKMAPDNVVFLTLGCCKYRFCDLDLGKVDGYPRLVDVGQCNDLYGILIGLTSMARKTRYDVNALPVSFFYAWYAQTAVANFLTLMYFGFRKLFVGPQMAHFFTPEVSARFMIDRRIRVISTPEHDLVKILGDNDELKIIDRRNI